MDLVERVAGDAGIAPDHILIERFANASAIGAIDRQPIAVEENTVVVEPPAATTAVPTTLTITIKRRRHVLEHVPGDTVLDSARRASLKPPFFMRAGQLRHLHGTRERGNRGDAGQQRTHTRGGRRGLDPHLPGSADQPDVGARVRRPVSTKGEPCPNRK